MRPTSLPIAVIGAGPIGLAAAAQLVERGETPLVLEAGPAVGHAVRQWAHVRMFSPWEYNLDQAAVRLLAAAGWQSPPLAEIPTGGELVERYLEPLARVPSLAPHIRLDARVSAVARKGHDKVRTGARDGQPFVLRVVGRDGREEALEAKAVVDASGTWFTPNPAGADGLPAIGETAASARIYYGIPDVLGRERSRYAGKTVLVLGAGHSALNALIELAALRQQDPATRVIWAMRRERIAAAFGGEGADQLAARGALGTQARALVERDQVRTVLPFHLSRIEHHSERMVVVGEGEHGEQSIVADEMIVATGFRPDLSFLREVRLTLDPWLESSGEIGPLIDPNLHSCGTVRPHGARELAHAERDFYIAGMKSYGRAPTFLLATGHEQVRSIAAMLTGDVTAAQRVELKLPETGVCNARPPAALTAASSCCPAKPAPNI